jgi:hypothetical protein
MQTCFFTRSEDTYAARLAAEEAQFKEAAESLAAEYMACATMPLLASVHAPTISNPNNRFQFLDLFGDGLGMVKNRHIAARAVSLLLASKEGREILEALAVQHGEDYADGVAQ